MSSLLNKISGALDNVKDKAATAVLKFIEPKVREEISERVIQFKDKSLKELPENVETEIESRADSNPAAWAVTKTAGDDTDKIISRLIAKMRPGIDEHTRDLAQQATRLVMERVKAAVIGAEEEDRTERSAGGAPAAAEVSQDRGVPHSRGISLKMDRKMPGMERDAREAAHPLFEQLEAYVQGLAPLAMREALEEQLLDKHKAAGGGAQGQPDVDRATAHQDRGLLDKLTSGKASVSEWFSKTSSGAIAKAIDVLITSLKGPVAEMINRLVAELEETSMTNAFGAVRAQLQQYHLLEKPAAGAAPVGQTAATSTY